MNLKTVNFEAIKDCLPEYGLSRKYAEIDYLLDDVKIHLEMTLTEYAGDKDHDAYYSLDFRQGSKKFMGDEFSTLTEALEDAEYRILDLYDGYELTGEDNDSGWDTDKEMY